MYRKIKIRKIIFYIFILICIIFLYYILQKKQTESFENSEYAYVINLEERTDRLIEIQNKFKDAPFTLVRFNAVKSVTGQEGCARSFVNLVRMAYEKNLPTILVLEDDTIPEPNCYKFWNIVKTYLDNHLNDWEIFNGNLHGLSLIENVVKLSDPVTLIKTRGGYLTNWIYINKNAYTKILKWEEKGKPLIDLWFSSGEFNYWCCYPLLGIQSNGYSDIDKSIKNSVAEQDIQKSNYETLLNIRSGSNTN